MALADLSAAAAGSSSGCASLSSPSRVVRESPCLARRHRQAFHPLEPKERTGRSPIPYFPALSPESRKAGNGSFSSPSFRGEMVIAVVAPPAVDSRALDDRGTVPCVNRSKLREVVTFSGGKKCTNCCGYLGRVAADQGIGPYRCNGRRRCRRMLSPQRAWRGECENCHRDAGSDARGHGRVRPSPFVRSSQVDVQHSDLRRLRIVFRV